MDKEKIVRVIVESVTYCPDGSDFDIFIDGFDVDEATLWGHSEDGEEYEIPFDEIDLDKDSFFKYVKVDVDSLV